MSIEIDGAMRPSATCVRGGCATEDVIATAAAVAILGQLARKPMLVVAAQEPGWAMRSVLA